AMDEPRPGRTTFLIMVSPLPGKYDGPGRLSEVPRPSLPSLPTVTCPSTPGKGRTGTLPPSTGASQPRTIKTTPYNQTHLIGSVSSLMGVSEERSGEGGTAALKPPSFCSAISHDKRPAPKRGDAAVPAFGPALPRPGHVRRPTITDDSPQSNAPDRKRRPAGPRPQMSVSEGRPPERFALLLVRTRKKGRRTVPGDTAIPGRCVEWTEQAPAPAPRSKNQFNMRQRGGSRKQRRRDPEGRGTAAPTPVCDVTEPRPDRPGGGSAAMESSASLITPKRSVAEPSASRHRNPWLEPNERQVSDRLVVLAKFSAILDFVANLLLQASARHWARKILWSPTVKDDPEKAEISIQLGEGTPKRSE
ncbi:hypothetical protein M9458_055804, partial [Cirrhinus mrigala]